MEDILHITEAKPAASKPPAAKKMRKAKAKYTPAQKASVQKAITIADELNDIMKRVSERNETR